MSMERWWIDNERGKLKSTEEKQSQSHLAHHKFQMHCPGTERKIPLLKGT
jgi:hypothetical protein